MANDIEIGKGEDKSIIFKITDIDSLFLATDKLLFAMRRNVGENKFFLFSEEVLIGDITPEVVDGKNVYSFLVHITSELSRSFSGIYYYDLTLITANAEETPLMIPAKIIITGTIGASVEKAVE